MFIKDFLTRFNTNYIDLGMSHFVDTEDDYREAFDSPYIEYVQKLKENGIVRFLGASTHDSATGMEIVKTGLIDMVMFSINPTFDLSSSTYSLDMLFEGVQLDKLQVNSMRADIYTLCAAEGIGITVMKALVSGRLSKNETSSLGYGLTLPQCVSYSLDRPAVSSVFLGAQMLEEIRQALTFEYATSEERDYASVMQRAMPLLGGKCMSCSHCLPCPQGIDVTAVTKYLDMAKISGGDTVHAPTEATA